MTDINQKQFDELKHIISEGLKKSSELMNMMLRSNIRLNVLFIKVKSEESFIREIFADKNTDFDIVSMNFSGDFVGSAKLFFPKESSMILARAFIADNSKLLPIYDEIKEGMFSELGNILLNVIMGTLSNRFDKHFEYSVPEYTTGKSDDILSDGKNNGKSEILLILTRFIIEELEVEGNIALFFKEGSIKQLLNVIDEKIQ